MTISDEVKFGVIEGHIVSDCPLVDLVKVLLKLTGIFFCLDTIANAGREYLKNLLWLQSSFGNRNPEPFAMVAIETWSFAMVSIRIATLIETLIATLFATKFRIETIANS